MDLLLSGLLLLPLLLLLGSPWVVRGLSALLTRYAPHALITRFARVLAAHPSLSVGASANLMVCFSCLAFALLITPGGHGRPMAFMGFLILPALLAPVLGGLSAIRELAGKRSKLLVLLALILCALPFPLGRSLILTIVDHYQFTLDE